MLIDDKQYTQKIAHLGNAGIGSHSRHIIELLTCVLNGYPLGLVDYINRSRDLSLETQRSVAIAALMDLQNQVKLPDKQLRLRADQMDDAAVAVTTTYFREIVYNAEHALHHLALIKVALIEMKLDLVDEEFGVAFSTIQYKASLIPA